MSRHFVQKSLAAWFLLATTSCKSNGSDVKDAEMDAIKAALPPGLVAKAVPSNEIERWVQAADGANGIPSTLNGLWWTQAKTVHFVASFKNVRWNAETRTASLLFKGPGMYSHPFQGGPREVSADGFDNYRGYDIVFAPDFKTAQFLPAFQDSHGNREVEAASVSGYTMEFIEDGHWIRHTVGAPDYHLWRIVQADGKTRVQPNYDNYLKDLGATMVVDLPALKLTAATPDITVKMAADQAEAYLMVPEQGVSRVDAQSKVPISVETARKVAITSSPSSSEASSSSSTVMSAINGWDTIVTLRKTDASATEVKLHLSKLPVTVMNAEKMTGSLDLAAGSHDGYIMIDSDAEDRFTLDLAAATPLHIAEYRLRYATVTNDGNHANSIPINASSEGPLVVAIHADQAVTKPVRATLSVRPTGDSLINWKVPALASAKNTTVKATLASVDAINIHKIDLTPSEKTAGYGKLTITVTDASNKSNCCFTAFIPDHNDYKTISGYLSGPLPTFDMTYRGQDPHFIVRYDGDFNVSSQGLSYTVTVTGGP